MTNRIFERDGKADGENMELDLGLPEPLDVTRLEADSARKAYYIVSLYYLPGAGYIIRKRSGAAGSRGVTESYFRQTYSEAIEKKLKLINGKLHKGSREKKKKDHPTLGASGVAAAPKAGRTYRRVPPLLTLVPPRPTPGD